MALPDKYPIKKPDSKTCSVEEMRSWRQGYNKFYSQKQREKKILERLDTQDLNIKRNVDLIEIQRDDEPIDVDEKYFYKSECESIERLKERFQGVKGTLILGIAPTFKQWLELRDRSRKDLFWFGKEVLKKDFVGHVHQPVCDQFVQKNFDNVYYEGYTLKDVHRAIERQERFDNDGNPTRELILLDSRGFYKSTIDMVDCVQWVINVPDIRILIITGVKELAQTFMGGIKNFFGRTGEEELSDFQKLFPEYIVTGVDATSDQPITVPMRRHKQEQPTIGILSIGSSKAGWHSDVLKADDTVTESNCTTPESREKLKTQVDNTANLVMDWGFTDIIGTRYYEDDYYGTRLEAAGEGAHIKYFCRACWYRKPEYIDDAKYTLKELTLDMVVLTFPEMQSTPERTFSSLKSKLIKNEKLFRSQQLNEPALDDGFRSIFIEENLRSHTYQQIAVPKIGDVYVAWDWALTHNKKSDLSCGVAGRIYKRDSDGVFCLTILEVIYGRWTPSELATKIVFFNDRYKPKNTIIENSMGSEFLKAQILTESQRYKLPMGPVYWKPPSSDYNAKANRIRSIEIALRDDRIWFVQGPWLDDVFFQFCRFTGEPKNRGRKDDIPDAISYLVTYFLPSSGELKTSAEELKKQDEVKSEAAMLAQHYNTMFGPSAQKTQAPAPKKPDPMRDLRARIGLTR